MKVVLRQDLEKVGKRGDIVEVANGFARNFLLPRGQAISASKGITSQANAMRAARDKADAKNREAAEQIAKQIVGATVKISARAGAEGKLFGSVTNAEIAEAAKDQLKIDLDRRQIEGHEHLRTVGEHQVPVKLHPDVRVSLNVEIVETS